MQVVITASARADLTGIYQRHRSLRGSTGKDGADALLDRLVARAMSLQQHPLRGPVCPELEALGIDVFRQLSEPPYRLIYSVDEAAGQTAILVIADSRRDFRTLLEERLLRTR